MTTACFLIGLDPGQAVDPAAVVVVERSPVAGALSPTVYAVRHARRLPLGTPYPAVVSAVVALAGSPELSGRVELVVDHGGAGRPVVDLLRKAAPCKVVPVTITSGRAVSIARDGALRVPKRQLVQTVRLLLRGRRLRIASSLPEAASLLSELQNFRMRLTGPGRETYGARSGAHDDLVLSTSLACWWGELRGGGARVPGRAAPSTERPGTAS
jgi:hypothetical protein